MSVLESRFTIQERVTKNPKTPLDPAPRKALMAIENYRGLVQKVPPFSDPQCSSIVRKEKINTND